jgi:hypothetical protein
MAQVEGPRQRLPRPLLLSSSREPNSGTRLPPWVASVEALVGPKVLNARSREPSSGKPPEPIPSDEAPLATP